MDGFKFSCPKCGGHISVEKEMARRAVACPHCAANILIPGGENPRTASSGASRKWLAPWLTAGIVVLILGCVLGFRIHRAHKPGLSSGAWTGQDGSNGPSNLPSGPAKEGGSRAPGTHRNASPQPAATRQTNLTRLHQQLADAAGAQARNEITNALKLYTVAGALALEIGSGVEAEAAQARAGLTTTRLALARDAQDAGDYATAAVHIKDVLRADPANTRALELQRANDRFLAEQDAGGTEVTENVTRCVVGAGAKSGKIVSIGAGSLSGTMSLDGQIRHELDKPGSLWLIARGGVAYSAYSGRCRTLIPISVGQRSNFSRTPFRFISDSVPG